MEPAHTRWLLACGVIGPVFFSATYLIEGAFRPSYDPLVQEISALSLTDLGWIQILNFIVSGILILLFAIGLKKVLKLGRGATLGPLLVAIAGLSLVVAGIFVTDPQLGYPPGTPPGPLTRPVSLHGLIHNLAGLCFAFIGLPGACVVLALRFAREPPRKAWSIYSGASSILIWVSSIGFQYASLTGGYGGLVQRVDGSIGFAWIALLAVSLWRQVAEDQ